MIKTSSGVTLDGSMVDTTYLTQRAQEGRTDERYIVSLIIGYDSLRDQIVSPEQAVAAAVALTKDAGQEGTLWWVWDQELQSGQFVSQGDVAHLTQEMIA